MLSLVKWETSYIRWMLINYNCRRVIEKNTNNNSTLNFISLGKCASKQSKNWRFHANYTHTHTRTPCLNHRMEGEYSFLSFCNWLWARWQKNEKLKVHIHLFSVIVIRMFWNFMRCILFAHSPAHIYKHTRARDTTFAYTETLNS